jgi:Spy/CpxP family protein refolding chaperone
MKKVKVFVMFLSLVLATGLAYAADQSKDNPGDNPKIEHPGPYWHHGHNWLNLTSEQKTKLKELGDKFRKDTVLLRNGLKVKRLELRALWTVPRPEKEKIIAKEKEIIDLTTQLRMKAIDFRLEARSLLTPEQAAQVGMWGPRLWRGHLKRQMMRG